MTSSWAFVFLLFIGASFFAKLGSEVSRLWLSAFFFLGLAALIAERLFLRAMVRAWARQGRLDRRTIIVGSDHNGERLVEALKAQDDSDIHILGVFDDRNDNRALESCAGSPKLGKVVGGIILLLALPVMAAIALAIKLDSQGPVLFRQKRFGFNNERIDVFKFRSLYHDQADPLASKAVTKNDKRVTRVGGFIRKT